MTPIPLSPQCTISPSKKKKKGLDSKLFGLNKESLISFFCSTETSHNKEGQLISKLKVKCEWLLKPECEKALESGKVGNSCPLCFYVCLHLIPQ